MKETSHDNKCRKGNLMATEESELKAKSENKVKEESWYFYIFKLDDAFNNRGTMEQKVNRWMQAANKSFMTLIKMILYNTDIEANNNDDIKKQYTKLRV